jgi:hypothetical protein
MSYDLTPDIKLPAQDHDFHSQELVRLRDLAATITTKAVKCAFRSIVITDSGGR